MCSVQAKKLGEKYILLDLLGTGGMAEVYRGKLLGEKGFQKPIVIKQLLPHVAQDKEMTQLFIGEAKLAALLQHENIAATFDFGELDNNFFLAMEYLFGKDLYTVMQRAKECKKPLGVNHSLMIAAKICEGMDYAHSLKDLQNNPLNIIHRDLTPQNIFITYDGKVKVIDFGVAKAEILDNKTRAGVVKGKVSYMSPEQISGGVIDSRSDIFSIGILLYEMISKRRMYDGNMADLIRKSITVEYEPLETIIQELPPQLYVILHKALISDLELRYQSCAEMQADIENLLFGLSERPDSRVLKKYIQELFEHEHESEQRSMVNAMETVVANLDHETASPAPDKTVFYDTLADDDDQKTSFVHSNPAAERGKWQDNKKGYFLIAAICLIAFVAFLSFGVKKEDVTPVVSPPVVKVAELPSSQDVAPIVSPPVVKVTEPPSSQDVAPIASPPVVKVAEQPFVQEIPEKTKRSDKKSKAREFARQAEKALSEQKIVEAQEFVDNGLKLSPYNQNLHNLNGQIKKKKQLLVQWFAAMAEQRLDENNLTTPEGDSAFYYYREILKIDPDSTLVQDAFQEMADRYASMAEQAYKYYDFETTRQHVEKGLMVMPNHAPLLELKGELNKSKAENYKKSTEESAKRIFNEGVKGFEGLFGK